jgi:uncharacterized protein YjiS (DUF1127 family)
MTALSLPLPSGRGTPLPSGRGTRRRGVRRFLSELVDGLREGHALATRYDTLARKSDAELARLGLKREDIPRAVFSGRKR